MKRPKGAALASGLSACSIGGRMRLCVHVQVAALGHCNTCCCEVERNRHDILGHRISADTGCVVLIRPLLIIWLSTLVQHVVLFRRSRPLHNLQPITTSVCICNSINHCW